MTLQAGVVLNFGLDAGSTSGATSYGLLQTYDITTGTKRAKAIAPDGYTTSIQEYTYEKTLSMTYLPLDSGATGVPAVGTTFTFDSNPWQIDTISDSFVVDGFENVSLIAKWYPKIH